MKPAILSLKAPRPSRSTLSLRYLATIAWAICLFTPWAQADEGDILWSRTFGGLDEDVASCVIQTSDGGYAMAGITNSVGAGGNDMWLIKTDANGNLSWDTTYGGPDNDRAYAIVQTSDSGYVLAGFTYSFSEGYDDMWLVKTNAQGDCTWSRTYGGWGYDAAFSLIQTTDGGYALAGRTTTSGAGYYDMYLVKTDSAGVLQWDSTYGGSGYDGAGCVIQTSDGGYLLAGGTDPLGADESDMYLVKTDSLGNTLWPQFFGGDSSDGASSVIETSDGGYLAAGLTRSFGAGEDDMWLVMMNAQGKASGVTPMVEIALIMLVASSKPATVATCWRVKHGP